MSFFDVFRKTLNVKRQEGVFIDGDFIVIDTTYFNIKASVQPTPAEVLDILPEGYRDKETYTLYSDSELKTSEAETRLPDEISIGNYKYVVIKVAKWQNKIINNYQIVVLRQDAN